MRRRYSIEVERTPDDRVQGIVRLDGLSEAVPFTGWIELMSILQPSLVAQAEAAPADDAPGRRAG